ncbi:MAG: hypothetical protein QOJ96_1629 [Alphaproteobacteria bacterium]|nr:hypothetical protein [Alphaproteobacteria bacterium]
MRSDDTAILRSYWKPAGKLNRKHESRLTQWMQSNRLSVADISSFLYLARFRNARAKAAKDLTSSNTEQCFSADAAKLRKFWKPRGRIHLGNQKKLQFAIEKLGLKEKSITHFLYHSKFQDKHKKALNALGR